MARYRHQSMLGAFLCDPNHCLLLFVNVVIAFTPLLVGGIFLDQDPYLEEWSYPAQNDWQRHFPTCGKRSRLQSPINIKRENVITNKDLILKFYNYNRPFKFIIHNARHTIKMYPIYPGSPQSADEIESTLDGPPDEGHLQSDNLDHHNQQHHSSYSYKQAVNRNFKRSSQIPPQPRRPPTNTNSLDQARREQQHNDQNITNSLRYDNANNDGPSSSMATNNQRNDSADHELNSEYLNHSDEDKQRLPYDGAPMIKLGWVDSGNNEYRLYHIHFHWGTKEDDGSEHLIDGRRSAMEIHLVHIKNGLQEDQISYNSDSVVVIAVMVEPFRKGNSDFNPIVNKLADINVSDARYDIEYGAISYLLPNNRDRFYTYSGSLTTPPCNEVVRWIVMDKRVLINAKQMESFRNIYARVDVTIDNNKLSTEDGQPVQSSDFMLYKLSPNIRREQNSVNRFIMASFYLDNDSDNETGAAATLSLFTTVYPLLTLLMVSLLSFVNFFHYHY